MAFDPVSAALDIGGKLIDRLWPDPAQRDAAKLELLKMQQSGEMAILAANTDLAKGQLAVNAAEAASGSLFVGGWRPAIGWVCAAALAYQYLFVPVGMWAAQAAGVSLPAPITLDDSLWQLMLGMLGLGGLRTAEKFKGVAKG